MMVVSRDPKMRSRPIVIKDEGRASGRMEWEKLTSLPQLCPTDGIKWIQKMRINEKTVERTV